MAKRPKGRWPLDLVREFCGRGLLALRVWRNAGLEQFGLFDEDLVIISLEDPDEGEPALAAINDDVIIGIYQLDICGRVTIQPLVKGTPSVAASAEEFQALFALRAIAYRAEGLNPEQRAHVQI